MLFPSLLEPTDAEAVRVADRALSYRELRAAAGTVAARVEGLERVALWATPTLETCAAAVGVLAAGVTLVPLNPRSGERELGHVLFDSTPALVIGVPGESLGDVEGWTLDVAAPGPEQALPAEAPPEAPALVVYTSGTTGPPKGAVLPRRALATNLDALAAAWAWTDADTLVHGLPFFHVHGLVLGVLGPVRRGGHLHHVGRFEPEAVAGAIAAGGTMLFGVPTMYRRLAEAAERQPEIRDALAGARLLVSGSAPLPAAEHERLERICGQRVVERYGMTETLMITAVRSDGDRRPSFVGPPLEGVEVRLVDDDGAVVDADDDVTIGEVQVRGPNLFLGYLNQPEATAAVEGPDGWFLTGDVATRAADGYVQIVGRRATDLIKSGGYKIGAGEIEAVLLEYPTVAEAAVTGRADDELGERVVAWVVAATEGPPPDPKELIEHVAGLLAPHKRPRAVHLVAELPRNELGKVRKTALAEP